MQESVFTSFVKEHRPLSEELWRKARPLADRIRTAKTLDDLEVFREGAVADAVRDLDIQAPRLGRATWVSDQEGETRWNAARTVGSPTHRFDVAVEVLGDLSLLRFWPDGTALDLSPVDATVAGELGGVHAVPSASVEDVSRFLRAQDIWEIGSVDMTSDGGSPNLGLRTHLDLTLEEEQAVARGTFDLVRIISERRDGIAPIVAAIEEQVQEFLAKHLPLRLLESAEVKREELSNRQAVRESLSFPEEWRASEPEVEDEPPDDSLPSARSVPEEPASESDEVRLNPRSRLSRATFDDVQSSLRHWANAVERYPAAFGVLPEDRISDLLAATWNATLPGAGREVYTRGGKSDIFIQADVLDPGLGPAKVFICEAKWANGRKVIQEALDPQLFGYLNVHDTAAILLVLLSQRNFAKARSVYLSVLESVDGYKSTSDGPVAGWPLLEFKRDGRKVDVCAAFVHLPRPPGAGT